MSPGRKAGRQEPIPESGLKAEGVGGSSEQCLVATAEKQGEEASGELSRDLEWQQGGWGRAGCEW